jgi:hypothetical protein
MSLRRLALLAGSWVVIGHVAAAAPLELWGARYTYTPPRLTDHLPYWLWPWKAKIHVPTGPNSTRVIDVGSTLGWFLASAVIAPVWVCLLGRFWSRAEFGWRHIARATLLSVPMVVMLAPLALGGHVLSMYLEGDNDESPWTMLLMMVGLVWYPVAVCSWWRVCLGRYFETARAGTIGVSVFGLVILSVAASIIAIDLIREVL